MQWGFTRYEFAPTDVGGPITDARVIARIEGEFRALGWEQCTEVFGTRDHALLLPRTYAIVSKGDTFDLDAEIARAETNLESAVATMAYYDERSNLKGRRLIEFAAWVFGVAGLAELLVELPLRPNTFATHPFSFAAWLLLATVGGIVVFRQR